VKSKLAVIAGPTAVGKGTVVRRLLENHPEIKLSVSATTRAPRPGEVDGVDYYFWTSRQFDSAIKNGELLEYATVHGSNRYGTPRKPVEEALSRGEKVVLEIDIQGARQVKKVMPEALTIFILPPSWEELVRRLSSRGTEDDVEQNRRLQSAVVELASADDFDHQVINGDVDKCAAKVLELMS
jgi:guanylate kinase